RMALILRLRTTVAPQTSSEMSQTQPLAPIRGQIARRITPSMAQDMQKAVALTSNSSLLGRE
ncbi:hypothetical protein, partial [Bradyrhizobium sp. 17]|uniref:hypothetical protein n=1 Tax=Bradyrhizobium sp. 17 TaxID=2782649 RepID=UPI001FFAE77F